MTGLEKEMAEEREDAIHSQSVVVQLLLEIVEEIRSEERSKI